MGDQLVRTVFDVLLGWVRGIMAWLFNRIGQQGGEGFSVWFRQNWFRMVLFLCIAGALIDLLVYLFRWQPLKVWRTFFRRLRHRREGSMETDMNQDDIVMDEPDPVPEDELTENPDENWPYPERMARGSSWGQMPEIRPEPTVVSNREKFQEAILPGKKRFQLSGLLNQHEEDEVNLNYKRPEPAIDEREAYYAPVYPQKWQDDAGEYDSSYRRRH